MEYAGVGGAHYYLVKDFPRTKTEEIIINLGLKNLRAPV